MNEKRKEDLADHTEASRQIELAHHCVRMLEAMHGPTPQSCIKALKAMQQMELGKQDRAAIRLGAK